MGGAGQEDPRRLAVVPLIYTRNSFLHGSQAGGVEIGRFPAYVDYRKFGIIQ